MFDVLIIGAGPAGVTAAIYLKRAGKNVAVIYKDGGSLERTVISNFYSYDEISGNELFNKGLNQLDKNSIQKFKEEVLSISFLPDGYEVKTNKNSYETKYLILASGMSINAIDKRYKDYIGRGVSTCAICDGPLHKNKKVYVTGKEPYLSNMIHELKDFTNDIEVIDDSEIVSLEGDALLERINLKDKMTINTNFIFLAIPLSPSSLYSSLGIMKDENERIKVNSKMETNLKGIYAIGDVASGKRQIAKALYDGMISSLSIIEDMKR